MSSNEQPKERLVLVRDWSEIKPFMIVVISPCDCGGKHRGIVMNMPSDPVVADHPRGSLLTLVAEVVPTPACAPSNLKYCIGPPTVQGRLVFKVVDGEEVRNDKNKQKKQITTSTTS